MPSSYKKRDLRGVDSTRREEALGAPKEIVYEWSPTAAKFHNCMKPVKGIRGPFAGGKSVTCCWEIRYKAEKVEPDEGGVRRSKFLVCRSTFAQLKKTAIPTWLEWFPDTVMKWGSPTIGTLKQPSMRGDGTSVEIILVFQGIRHNESLEAIKGLELSGAWMNEASDIREDALAVIRGRCGRYPRKTDRVRTNNLGVIMDTNSPGETNWWYRLAEIERPDDMEFFSQPPAVLRREKDGRVWYEPNDGRDPGIPPAENAEHLSDGYDYWLNQTKGASPNFIKRFLMNEYTNEVNGAPVYHEYVDAVHFVDGDVEPMWGIPLILGTDYGRTPCSVIGQVRPDSQIVVFDELCTKDCSIDEYVDRWLKPWLFNKYRFGQGARIASYGDPAGANKEQGISLSVIQIMTEKGVPTLPCPVPNNDFMLRRDAVGDSLRRRVSEGKPGLVICRSCVNLRKGFLGDYHYRTMVNSDGTVRTAERPDKSRDDPASHVHDALQYMVYSALHPDGADPFSTRGADARLWLPRSEAGKPRTVGLDLAGYF